MSGILFPSAKHSAPNQPTRRRISSEQSIEADVAVKLGSQTVIQMPRPVALGIGEHGGRGGVAVAVPAGEQEDRECPALHFLPDDCRDLPSDELRVMLALDFRRAAHDGEWSPTWVSSRPWRASVRRGSSMRLPLNASVKARECAAEMLCGMAILPLV